MQTLLAHVVSKVTDAGLVIEVFDLDATPLFEKDTDIPTQTLTDISILLSEMISLTENQIAVDGFVRSYPVMIRNNPTWALSAARAQAMRSLLEQAGTASARVSRITGHADRQPATVDPSAVRNNRIEIVLLRKDR